MVVGFVRYVDITLVAESCRSSAKKRARVIWVEGRGIGIAFDAPFDVAATVAGWNDPEFEVSRLHSKIGADCRRPAIGRIT